MHTRELEVPRWLHKIKCPTTINANGRNSRCCACGRRSPARTSCPGNPRRGHGTTAVWGELPKLLPGSWEKERRRKGGRREKERLKKRGEDLEEEVVKGKTKGTQKCSWGMINSR